MYDDVTPCMYDDVTLQVKHEALERASSWILETERGVRGSSSRKRILEGEREQKEVMTSL